MSQGSVPNVGGPDKPVIRPQHPPKPMNPPASQGAPSNVGGGTEKPVVRGGTSGPTG